PLLLRHLLGFPPREPTALGTPCCLASPALTSNPADWPRNVRSRCSDRGIRPESADRERVLDSRAHAALEVGGPRVERVHTRREARVVHDEEAAVPRRTRGPAPLHGREVALECCRLQRRGLAPEVHGSPRHV